MAKKTIKMGKGDLENIINETIDTIISPKSNSNANLPDEWFAQEPDEDDKIGYFNYSDELPTYGEGDADEFQEKIMELCADGASTFQNIIDVFEHTDYSVFKNYDYARVLGKVKNICDLIEKIWDSND